MDEQKEPTHNWQTAFKLKPIEKQAQVYAFESELRAQEKRAPALDDLLTRTFQVLRGVGMTIHSSIEAEHHLRAAIKAGWLESPRAEIARITGADNLERVAYLLDGVEVGDLKPGKVRWYGERIQAAYNAATATPDPNS